MKTACAYCIAPTTLILALLVSGCNPGQIAGSTFPATNTAGQSPIPTETVRPTLKPTNTSTQTPKLFNQADTELYDNFNDSQYDGSLNGELWGVADQSLRDVFQKNGYLSIVKQKNTQECEWAETKKFAGYTPKKPLFIQADVKVDKLVSGDVVGLTLGGFSSEKTFMANCIIVLDPQNNLSSMCLNHWFIISDQTVTEDRMAGENPAQFGQWLTFRIDYDPWAATFTYFINNVNAGSYQVVDTESIKRAGFSLQLVACSTKGSGLTGYFDNIRIGIDNK